MTHPPPLSAPLRVQLPHQSPSVSLKRAGSCTMIIFGAGGDLTRRKLMPALFRLAGAGMLADDFTVLGVAREAMDDDLFRAAIRTALEQFLPPEEATKEALDKFVPRLHYVAGDFAEAATYAAVQERLTVLETGRPADGGRLFYLAIPPSVYATAIDHLAQSGVARRLYAQSDRPWVRVIIEKPFGSSLESAQALNGVVRRAFSEHQIYRIDHYLGKETVQNLLVCRFANSIFEPLWNRQHIHHVQITAVETVGVERRGRYYEEAGVVRDMFQNHLLQLLTLTAMEPPVTFSADAVRDEKAKVLHAIRPITPATMHEYSVRGQYGPGTIDGSAVRGYRTEPDVSPDSGTATYAAVRFMIDNWRWQGVPFYLRSAKRMPRRATEIAIQFRQPPHLMFPLRDGEAFEPNVLAIRVQPNEGISLRFEVKTPGVDVRMASVEMDFNYVEAFGDNGHEAYETLILDCMLGDATLFTRSDEVEAAWSVVDPMIEFWGHKAPDHFPNYAAGTWGPSVADEWIHALGCRWRQP